MKKVKYIFNVLLLLAIVSSPVYSQMKKVAQTGLQFLKIDAGAREASMAGAMTMAGFSANAVFYNPAGLGRQVSSTDVAINTTQWIADINYYSFAASYKLEDIGSFALSAVFSDYGDIIGTRVASNSAGYIKTGNVDVNAYAVGLSYAKNLSDKFSIGGTIKYVGQKLGSNLMQSGSTKENKVSGVAFDFGTIYYPGWKSFRFGMSVRNFSAAYEYEKESFELPLTFTIGVAMDVMDLVGMNDQTLLLSIDAVHPRDYTERLNVGTEYLLMDMFAIRLGYKSNNDNEGLTAGFGVNYEVSGIDMRVDYSYSAMEYFDAVNRFTIGFSF